MIRSTTAIAILVLAFCAAAPVRAAQEDPAGGEAAARAEFERLMSEIGRAQGRTPIDRLIDMAEAGMLGMLQRYPGTAASGSARVILAQIYSGIGRAEEARKHLRAYFEADYAKDTGEVQTAWLLLGIASLAADDFEAAERAFRTVLGSEGVNPQVRQMAADNLASIEARRKLRIGAPVVEFSAEDIAGRAISISDYRGKVFLLDFWATWCAPCHAEMPNVKRVYNDYREQGFDIIGISLDNSRDALERYLEQEQLGWRQIYEGGWQSKVGRLYAVNAIPATFLIDRQGRIRHKNLRGAELERAVRALLEEKPGAP